MNMLKKSLFAIGTAVMVTIIISGSAFANLATCLHDKNPKLSTNYNVEHEVKCPSVKRLDGEYVTLFAETAADCAQVAALASDPDSCINTPGQITQSEIEREEEEKKKKEESKVPLSAENTEYFKSCIGEGKKYPNLSLVQDDAHPKKCMETTIDKNQVLQFYAADINDCAEGLTMAIMPHGCADLPDTNTITTFQPCAGGEGKIYPNISLITTSMEYPIRCPVVSWKNKLIGFSAKTAEDCAKTQELVNNNGCSKQVLRNRLIFRLIWGAIGFAILTIIGIIVKKKMKKNPNAAAATTTDNAPKNNPFQPAKPGEAEWIIKPAEPAEPETPAAIETPAAPEATVAPTAPAEPTQPTMPTQENSDENS